MGVLTGQEADLRASVVGDLTRTGVLGKLRAQLRHHVYESLSAKADNSSSDDDKRQTVKGAQPPPHDKIVLELVHDALVQYHLDYTAATLKSEASLDDSATPDRDSIHERLGIAMPLVNDNKEPLLLGILEKVAKGTPSLAPVRAGTAVGNSTQIQNPLTRRARRMFDAYDTNGDGSMDKTELLNLFEQSFPHFSKQILNRYVNDEFRSSDIDFSGYLEFDEFLAMYSRIFVKVDMHNETGVDTPPIERKNNAVADTGTSKKKGEEQLVAPLRPLEAKTLVQATAKKSTLEDVDSEVEEDLDDLLDNLENDVGKSKGTPSPTTTKPTIQSGATFRRGQIRGEAAEVSGTTSSAAAVSPTFQSAAKPLSLFSDTDGDDDDDDDDDDAGASKAKRSSPSTQQKQSPSKEAEVPAAESSDLEDIDESIDDDDISSADEKEGDNDDDGNRARDSSRDSRPKSAASIASVASSSAKKKSSGTNNNDSYSNDFGSGDDDDDSDSISKAEIDAVSDISVAYSDEVTTDNSAISGEDQFSHEEDAF